MPTAAPLENGDTLYDVAGSEMHSYFNTPFWLAVRFWKNYKKFGLHKSDWRKITIQQLAVINLFDTLHDAKKE